jgi:hypothetical protein
VVAYEFTDNGSRVDSDGVIIDVFAFHATLVNQRYIVEVLHMEHDIYVVQFFLKNHRLSGNRFNMLLNADNKTHVFYVLNTIVNIVKTIIKRNSQASFGFMGAPIRRESSRKYNSKNINPDGTIKNTKRFSSYSLYVKRYFPPTLFTHIDYEDTSCYLLKNNKNVNLTKEVSDNYLNEVISAKYN